MSLRCSLRLCGSVPSSSSRHSRRSGRDRPPGSHGGPERNAPAEVRAPAFGPQKSADDGIGGLGALADVETRRLGHYAFVPMTEAPLDLLAVEARYELNARHW